MKPIKRKSADKAAPVNKERKFSPNAKAMFLKPRLSEKTYGLSETYNIYTFEIPQGATKHTVAEAILAQYGEVGIKSVRIATIPGKTQRSYRRKGRNVYSGQRANTRKAYVTLKEGDKLPIYAAVEEANTASREAK